MVARVLNGKVIAEHIERQVEAEVSTLRENGVMPLLAVLLVGDNPASHRYVRNKMRVAQKVGIKVRDYFFHASASEARLFEMVDVLNRDARVHGILVQLPLPAHINGLAVVSRIAPEKDVDGLHPLNLGRLLAGKEGLVPCTPASILELCRAAGIVLGGAHVVIVGRSILVGKPAAFLFLRENATVTICNSHTKNLQDLCKRADILVVAVGKARMITADYIKPGAVVIDVGINEERNRLVGDVDFNSVKDVAGTITPVPGGVGPMTIAMLMKNVLYAVHDQTRSRP